MSEKKLSISKKTVLIASALVLAIGIPLAYLLWSSNQEDSGAWYNSSWLYRRSISVSNPGSTLTNEDVLIEYDTSALVTAGKLQSDCDDLRFVDSDDSTALAYWIEGGCNTTTTHIWVRIPSLPPGGKTIYMYYGNSSATNAEETWTGKFYLMKDTSCDSGWTTESNSYGEYYQRFPYASSNYGHTGGNISHNHGQYSLTTSTITSGVNITTTPGSSLISIAHSHSVDLVVEENPSVLPPYLDMIFCSNSDLIVTQNGIVIFTTTVPSGFTRFSSLDNKIPRGNSTYGGTSSTSVHNHSISVITTTTPSATGISGTGSTQTPSSTHTHTSSSTTTDAASQLPPYTTVIFGIANTNTMTPKGGIMISDATPPLGWSRYTNLDGYFPYGSTSYGTTGGSLSHNHTIPSISFPVTSSTVSISNSSPTQSVPSISHTHSTASITSTDVSNMPPYIESLFIQKKISQTVTINNEEDKNYPPSQPSSLYTESVTNNTKVIDTTPEFSAIFSDSNTSNTGTYYEIEVNTSSNFTGTVMWDSGQTAITPITNGSRSSNISYTGTTLTTNGTTYYWRIRFWDNGGEVSSWSETNFFTMSGMPSIPSQLYTENLINPTSVTDITPELSALYIDPNLDSATYYEIEVNTASNFSGTVMWDSGQISTLIVNNTRSNNISYSGTTLTTNGATYYWRIKFWDSDNNVSNWSSTAQFTMGVSINNSPNPPSSLFTEGVSNPTIVLDLTPELSAIFTDPDGTNTGNYYQIEVNTSSDFTGTIMWDSNQTSISPITNGNRSSDISYSGTALSFNGVTYYWRIRFWDNGGEVSSWSTINSFTLSAPPNTPSTSFTEGSDNPTVVTDLTPEFSAVFSDSNPSDTGNWYEIEVNTNSSFTGTIMWDSGQTSITPIANNSRSSDISYSGTSHTFDNTTYYWRIRFWDSNGIVSNWSTTNSYTMSGTPVAPSNLTVDGKSNPTSILSLNPEFSAQHFDSENDSATYYEIEVNTNSSFTGTVMWDTNKTSMTSTSSGQYIPDIPYAGVTLTGTSSTVYYWRIRLWDTNDFVTSWSTIGSFADLLENEQYIQIEGVGLERIKIN